MEHMTVAFWLAGVQVVVKYQGTPSGSGGPVGRPTAKMTIINTSFQDNTETDVSCRCELVRRCRAAERIVAKHA